MEERCKILEECPYLMYNYGVHYDSETSERFDTSKMRSILFSIMLEEVHNFFEGSVSSKQYEQVRTTGHKYLFFKGMLRVTCRMRFPCICLFSVL